MCSAMSSVHIVIFIIVRTAQLNLVCDSEYLKPLISSLHMIGVFVGAITSGQISDR